jgi:uncharacterized protein (DUF885 family)
VSTPDHTPPVGIPPIHALADRAVEMIADADPLEATHAGIRGRDDRWPDLSPTGHAARADLAAALATEARSCPVDGPDEELARRVLLADLDERVEHHAAGDRWYDCNSIESSLQSTREVVGLTADPADVAARLATIDEPLAGWCETLAEGRDRGVVVARRQVLAAIEQARAWSAPAGFADVSALPGCAEPAEAARVAMARTATWLESEYLPHAGDADAVGPERWERNARWHLGTAIDPAATYLWGWEEVRRLTAGLAAVAERIAPGEPPAAAIEVLRTDPARAAHAPEEFLAVMLERQSTAFDQLAGAHFDVDPRIRAIEVRPSPPGGSLAAHYTPPSEDFSRPGCIWYPLGGRTSFPLWEEVTTAHHEGFPGHHLQLGTQLALGDRVSRHHRTLVWKPGSGEGWALYAELLMGELGYLDRPDYEAGLLAAQLLRACRVVIDIGLHLGVRIPYDAPFHPGEEWTAAMAEEMLRDVAFVDPPVAHSEVVRYLGWPAQAISYKLGERAILELRAERRARDGTAFDPVAFHSDVLRAGAVGLDLLAEVVRSA